MILLDDEYALSHAANSKAQSFPVTGMKAIRPKGFGRDLTVLFLSMDWLGIPTCHTFWTGHEKIHWLLLCFEVYTGNNLLETADLCLGRNQGTRKRNWGNAQDASLITERDQASN